MNKTLIVARLTFREAVRRRIVLTGLILGGCFLAVYNLGFYLVNSQLHIFNTSSASQLVRTEGFNFLTLAGLYTVTFLSIAMGALISADSLAGEISSGTIQTVVAKPVRRASIVLGKWLGFALLLALYVFLMSGGILASVWLQSRYLPPHPLAGLGLIYLEALLVMSITLMCSSRLPALATGGVVFGLYGLAFIGGWVEQLGSLLQIEAAVQVGIFTSLIIPSEALWRRAAYEMQSPLSGALNMSPFGTISVPSLLMIAYAFIYTLVALLLAMRWFSTRDL